MENRELNHFVILAAKKADAEGKNITESLRIQKNVSQNTPEIIEVACNLPAGTYSESLSHKIEQASLYTAALTELPDKYSKPSATLLDVGTGNITTFSLVMSALKHKPGAGYAFDISWLRIYKGTAFSQEEMGKDYHLVTPFVGDINEIPLLDKSVKITTSSHTLGPNGGKLEELTRELFSVTVNKFVLFESCYEINSEEGKKRMGERGYIKNIDGIVAELGAEVIEKVTIKNIAPHLNPTVYFSIVPPSETIQPQAQADNISPAPGTNIPRQKTDESFYSNKMGKCYSESKGIPILKSNRAIRTIALAN